MLGSFVLLLLLLGKLAQEHRLGWLFEILNQIGLTLNLQLHVDVPTINDLIPRLGDCHVVLNYLLRLLRFSTSGVINDHLHLVAIVNLDQVVVN